MIHNIIKRAILTRVGKDSSLFRRSQFSWLSSKTATIEEYYPYGIAGKAPVGSLAIVFNMLGQEENRIALPYETKKRFKELKEGELQIGNQEKESSIKFDENGNIIIVGEDLNITLEGSANLNATGNVNITSPLVTINGNLSVTGEITALTSTSSLSSSDIRSNYNSHTHTAQGETAETTVASNNI